MSFHLAAVNNTRSPSSAADFRPLRLSGPDGLIAKYVAAAGSAAETQWSIPADRLLELADRSAGQDAILFRPTKDLSPDGSLEIYLLENLLGVASSDRTDVVCFFQPLRMRESSGGGWDIEPARGTALCESLSLTGGTSGGKWHWTDSPMTLGATVVGWHKCGSSGCSETPAKECCGSCSST